MSRKLLKQINNEWRSNLWLAVELLIVSVVMWYVADYLAVQATIKNTPMGIDATDCFIVEMSYVPAEAPEYDPSDSTQTTNAESVLTILDRINSNADVEIAALAFNSAIPYTQNSWNTSLTAADGKDSLITSYLGWRNVSADYPRVFRIRGAKGESPEEMAEVLRRGEALLGANTISYDRATRKYDTDQEWRDFYFKELYADKQKLVGRKLCSMAMGDSLIYRIGGIINNIKRLEYEMPNMAFLTPIDINDPSSVCNSRIVVRTKPGRMPEAIASINGNATTTYHAGNIFISAVNPFANLRKNIQSNYDEQVRNYIVIMVFLMVCIFLGLLGTFWFRTQQRVSEIAIRKVNGATSSMIFRRLIGEGILLLTVATPFAVVCDWLITHFSLNDCIWGTDYFEPARFLLTVVISYLLMALMIVLGIWFPARKAMKIEPAIALKDE